MLLDVAYAECSPAEDAAVRTHIAGCPPCASDLARIQAGLAFAAALPTLEPRVRTTESILAQARAQARSVRPLGQAPRGATPVPSSLADRIREFLGQFAMGRQVAMATTMILVAAVGLWFVPQTRHQELAVGHVVNPDPDGEAGPSDGIVPAAPLDLDLRQGRIRARSDEPERRRERAAAPSAESIALSGDPSELDQSKAKGEIAAESVAPRRDAPAGNEAEPAALSERSALADDALAATDERDGFPGLAPPSPAAEAPASPPAYATTGYGEATGGAARKALGASRSSSAELEMAESAEATGGGAPRPTATRPAAAPTASDSSASARAEADVVAASPEEAEMKGPEGLLVLARTYQHSGRCDAAVVQYEAFLKRAPRHRGAMLEVARCYRQLGRAADAARWMKRADAIARAATSPTPTPAQPATSVQGN